MDAKLTLKLNESVIEKAKKYASSRQLSLSKLVETYLDFVTSEDDEDEIKISPFVKSISTGKSIPIDADWKELRNDYINYLDEKHK